MPSPHVQRSFKIRGRAHLFTWSDIGDASQEDYAEAFKTRAVAAAKAVLGDELHWKVGKEQHQNGHWHVHLFVVRKDDVQKNLGRRMDIDGHHPNARRFTWTRESIKNGFDYPEKEDEEAIDNVESNDTLLNELFPEQPLARGQGDLNAAFRDALAENTYDAAMGIIRDRAPRDFVLQHATIERYFRVHFAPEFSSPYKISDFNRPVLDWSESSISKRASYVLVGPPGMGKTFYALANFERPLFVNHLDDLSKFNPANHDGIVFDEISVRKWPVGSIKSILDRELPRSIHIRYKTAFIPAGVKKIFCVNNIQDLVPEHQCSDDDLQAIESRKEVIAVEDKLF